MCMIKVNDLIYIFENHVDYPPLKIIQPSYIKRMFFVLHKLKEDL